MAFILYILMLSNTESATIHLGRVYFDMTQNTLIRESETTLRTIAARMNDEPNLLIDLYGYKYGRIAPNFDESGGLAHYVKNYMVTTFNIPADRIQSPDYAPTRSSALSKETEDHWVDIFVRQPDAILSWFENDVKVQPPASRPNWLTPLRDYYLYHGYKVTTGKRSSAHISYPGKGMLRMDEEAMVIIHSLSLERRAEPLLKNLRLQDGSLTALLNNVTTQDEEETRIEADREIAAQIQDTVVAGKLEELVVVFQQNADVAELGEEPLQQIHTDTIDDKESVLSIPPAAPTLVSPRMDETKYNPEGITFLWQPSGALSHLQVAGDSLFEQIAFDAYAASESLVTTLSENTYYWRVSGINEDSVEGAYTDYWTFIVEVDTINPELHIALARSAQSQRVIASGRTEINADLSIDDASIKKESDGSFSYVFPVEFQNDNITARAVDPAGNVTEKVCRIPGRPLLSLGVNSGVSIVTNDGNVGYESGLWYGVTLSKMLLPSVSLFTGAAVAMTSGRNDDISTMSDIVEIEIGIRKTFHTGGISPFVYLQAGFVWSQTSLSRRTHPGIINYGGTSAEPCMGGGVGGWIHLGQHWHLNIHADYMHIFVDDNASGKTESLIRVGIGIQDRML